MAPIPKALQGSVDDKVYAALDKAVKDEKRLMWIRMLNICVGGWNAESCPILPIRAPNH